MNGVRYELTLFVEIYPKSKRIKPNIQPSVQLPYVPPPHTHVSSAAEQTVHDHPQPSLVTTPIQTEQPKPTPIDFQLQEEHQKIVSQLNSAMLLSSILN